MDVQDTAVIGSVDRNCDLYKEQFKAGQHPRIEDFVDAAPPSEKAFLLGDLLDLDIHLRAVCRDEYIIEYERRFPEFIETVRKVVQSLPGNARYQWLERIGGGGYGDVWHGRDVQCGQDVAIKRPKGLNSTAEQVDELHSMTNEGQFIASHCGNKKHLQSYHDMCEFDGVGLCLITQYISGPSLDRLVHEQGPLDWNTAARYICDVSEDLAKLHAEGFVHRDVKPANIVLDETNDTTCLIDFGLATAATASPDVAGTPAFTAPEAVDRLIAPAIDVFGMGATLFYLIVGDLPFAVSSFDDVHAMVAGGFAADDNRFRSMPHAVENLTRRALRYEGAERPTLASFNNQLRHTLNSKTTDESHNLPPCPDPSF